MATLVKGTTFTSTATAGGMHQLVESATISGIDRSSVRSSEITLATLQALGMASPSDRELWQTTPNNLLGSYDLASLAFRGALPQVVAYTLGGVTAVVAGDSLMASGTSLTTRTLSLTTNGTASKVTAIALAACAVGSKSLCVMRGPVKAKVTGTVAAGHAVKPSSTNGALQDAGTLGTGKGWEVCGVANLGDSGGFSWITLRR